MKLYLLSRKDGCDYDETRAILIRAKNSKQARYIASNTKGANTWLNPKKSNCRAIKIEEKVKIIIGDFNAG